ncbi:MAG: diguanylate cyclase [Actinomycetota bacterium]
MSEAVLTLGDLTPEAGLWVIADAARRALRADCAGFWVLADDHEVTAIHTTETDAARRGLIAQAVGGTPATLPLLATVMGSRDPLVVVDDPRHPALNGPLIKALGLRCVLGIRLEHSSVADDGGCLGMLAIAHRVRQSFTPQDRAAARSLGNLATLALANARLHRETLEALASAEQRAETDPLTGVLNRRGLDIRLERAVAAAAEAGSRLSVLVLDLDAFKAVNDRGGHHAGDAVLKRVADLLDAERRAGDSVARMGGEEFVVVLPDTGTEGAWLVAERLRAAVAGLDLLGVAGITASIGVATYPQHGRSAGEILRAADSAMYVAKSSGRDRTVVFAPEAAATRDELTRLATAGREGYLGSVLALAAAVDARDPSTHAHSSTVARYAAAIAARLGLDGDVVERVRISGLLHDVGKVGIPDSILMKPGRLTDEEWVEMRRHPEIGARIIASPGLADVREWVLRHHERPDGRGYPDGLAGDDIPLQARILSVADAYEAMTATRPYREALRAPVARKELVDGRGTQFDPVVVDVFLDYLDAVATPDLAAADHEGPGAA